MTNYVTLIGRISEIENDIFKISVRRTFKNELGEYENDIIPVKLYENILKNAKEFLQKNDLVGIKGRLQNIDNKLVIVVEKITFLSSRD